MGEIDLSITDATGFDCLRVLDSRTGRKFIINGVVSCPVMGCYIVHYEGNRAHFKRDGTSYTITRHLRVVVANEPTAPVPAPSPVTPARSPQKTVEVVADRAFYIVWNPGASNPQVRHGSSALAKREADRLAKLNPGKEFFVMKVNSRSMTSEPTVETKTYA